MSIRYKRLWLPAAVAVAFAGQSLTAQAQDTSVKDDKAAKAQQKAASDKDQINQAAPDRKDNLKVQADKEKVNAQARNETTSYQAQGQAPKQFHAASQLIGKEITNAQNEELGEVNEIVLDQSNDRVAYVVLSHGGWADIGDKLFAIPFNAIQWGTGDEPARLNITKQRLENAPGFEQSNWPDMADSKWSTQVDTYWQQETRRDTRLSQQPARAEGDLRWVSLLSELIGRDVDNQDKNIGEIEDIYVDENGRLGFAAVSFGGTMGIGDSTALVPFSALTPRMGEADFQLTATEADLKATTIENQLEPGLDQPKIASVNKQFKAKPYWSAESASDMQTRRDMMRQQMAQRTQRDSAPRQMTNQSWQAESDYNKHFKAGDVKSFEGTIVSVGQFEPGSDASPGLRLRIRTQDNKTHTVHAGPRDYAQQKEVSLNPGDKVTIQGAQAQVDQRPVILASQIRVKEQTLELRDQQGKPTWKMDARSVQQAAPDVRTRIKADQDQLDSQRDKAQQKSGDEIKADQKSTLSADRREEMKENIEEGREEIRD